ncbi:hypothetical protein [Gloeocapsa sp. PCC 73106]|uniref:hypothetical protein n=1 Tax=Gloeocapsa sp. PCC 73106 TaxID=102232 RepID=UPI0002AC54F9|nr:hypothetical protein [Gloeocapsa sp. PCC 73106]ELR97815.1 hypothetical protein GLO73106DRAFT_00016320 [Gloeocapsa sp. PCC 73106]
MTQSTPKDTKQQIMEAFGRLLSEYQKAESKVATKEEEAEKAKNQQLLTTVADYTLDSIVNSMALLQLEFGNIINELSERLTNESTKLDDLQKAIGVESEHLTELRQVRLVADALYLLRQEHQEKLKNLENQINNQRETLTKEQEQTRKIWEKEAQEFITRINEERELLQQIRERSKADHLYSIERERSIALDEYTEVNRLQERELQETNQTKEKLWSEREKFLTDHQAEFEAQQKQAAGFEETLKQAYNEAKGEGIKDADREAKVKSDLLEKEWEATKQGNELKIQSLENTLAKQSEQIAELVAQLQAANTQAQSLAVRAFQSPTNAS